MEEGIIPHGHTYTLGDAVATRTFALMERVVCYGRHHGREDTRYETSQVGENAMGPLKFQGKRCAVHLPHNQLHILLPKPL